MTFTKHFCVMEYWFSGVNKRMLGKFPTREDADAALFNVAVAHNVPDGDYIGISELWVCHSENVETSPPPAGPAIPEAGG